MIDVAQHPESLCGVVLRGDLRAGSRRHGGGSKLVTPGWLTVIRDHDPYSYTPQYNSSHHSNYYYHYRIRIIITIIIRVVISIRVTIIIIRIIIVARTIRTATVIVSFMILMGRNLKIIIEPSVLIEVSIQTKTSLNPCHGQQK